MNISGILAKGAGAAGIGLLAYDAHHIAKEHSQMYSTRRKTDNIESLYYDTLSLSDGSYVKDKAKRAVLNIGMDTNIDTVCYKAGGYLRSMGDFVVNHAIPIGLSAAALLTKGVVSKASALGLAAYAAFDFLGEFGHKK